MKDPLTNHQRDIYKQRYYLLIIARIISAFLVFISPLVALITSFLFDTLDGINASRGGMSKHAYHVADKILDSLWYTSSMAFLIINIPLSPFLPMLLFLYFLRLVGLLLFIFFKKRWLFLLFPNIYENILVIILLGTYVPFLAGILEPSVFIVLFLIASGLKLLQESVMHLFQFSTTERILGMQMYWKKE